MSILEVDGLRHTYGGRRQVEAIGSFEATVDEGEFLCICGPSGCGKTTLLSCIAGLIRPSEGEVRLDGRAVTEPPEGVALVFQDYRRSLFPWMTVAQNVAFPIERVVSSRSERDERVREALNDVGLAGVEQQRPGTLSGGMQQRVAIARALAYRPRIMILDEPFASVDAQTRSQLEDLILRVRSDHGLTMLLVTHDIDEAVYLGDRVIVLSSAPSTIRDTVQVDLPAPRDQLTTKSDPRFAGLRARVLKGINTGLADGDQGADAAVTANAPNS